MAAPSRRPATWQDLLARGDPDRLEIVGGELVEKAAPSFGHGFTEGKLAAAFDPFNRRAGGPRGPGGWWIATEVHVGYGAGEIYCHDAAGWRRERCLERSDQWPVQLRPDWVCEIVSPKHEQADLVSKPRVLHAAEVPHYWIVDPDEKILLVHRWSRDGYIVVQRATSGETVRAEPFEAIELAVGELFGDEE